MVRAIARDAMRRRRPCAEERCRQCPRTPRQRRRAPARLLFLRGRARLLLRVERDRENLSVVIDGKRRGREGGGKSVVDASDLVAAAPEAIAATAAGRDDDDDGASVWVRARPPDAARGPPRGEQETGRERKGSSRRTSGGAGAGGQRATSLGGRVPARRRGRAGGAKTNARGDACVFMAKTRTRVRARGPGCEASGGEGGVWGGTRARRRTSSRLACAPVLGS